MELRYFSYTNISLQCRFECITMCFTDSFTWHCLRPVNEHRLRTVLSRFFSEAFGIDGEGEGV